jgi:hypothetical protein
MSAVVVQEIIERIKQLPEADRLLLEQRLNEIAHSEWRQTANDARQTPHTRGIDQATIDRAIDELRRPG